MSEEYAQSNLSDEDYEVDLERIANQPVSEGMHTFTIVDAIATRGPSGYPYWNFTVVPETAGEENKTARVGVSLSPKARFFMEKFLDAVQAPKGGRAKMNQFLNKRFRGEVKHEDYQGSPQARIDEMFPVTTVSATPPAQAAPAPAPAVQRRVVASANGTAAKSAPAPTASKAPAGKPVSKTATKSATKTAVKTVKGKLPKDAADGDDIPF